MTTENMKRIKISKRIEVVYECDICGEDLSIFKPTMLCCVCGRIVCGLHGSLCDDKLYCDICLRVGDDFRTNIQRNLVFYNDLKDVAIAHIMADWKEESVMAGNQRDE